MTKTHPAILGASLGRFQRSIIMQNHVVVVCQTAEESASIGQYLREYAQSQRLNVYRISGLDTAPLWTDANGTTQPFVPYEVPASEFVLFMEYADHYEYADYRYFYHLFTEHETITLQARIPKVKGSIVAIIVKDHERPQNLMNSLWEGFKSPASIDLTTQR